MQFCMHEVNVCNEVCVRDLASRQLFIDFEIALFIDQCNADSCITRFFAQYQSESMGWVQNLNIKTVTMDLSKVRHPRFQGQEFVPQFLPGNRLHVVKICHWFPVGEVLRTQESSKSNYWFEFLCVQIIFSLLTLFQLIIGQGIKHTFSHMNSLICEEYQKTI